MFRKPNKEKLYNQILAKASNYPTRQLYTGRAYHLLKAAGQSLAASNLTQADIDQCVAKALRVERYRQRKAK